MTKEIHKCGKRMTTSSRSLALEQAYVHDVYSVIAINKSLCSPVRSHVKEFLFEEFEMGSILLDVGCSDGKYLNLKSDIVVIGLDRCCEWFYNDLIKYKTTECGDKQQMTGDVMYLPFRDDFFDGVLCCGLLHHVSTVERRVRALKEITRILKIGGKLLLTVTSGPVLGRELQSQDVLIKLDKFEHNLNTNSDETDSDSSSSSYSNSNYGNTMYELCNSPTSESGSCYSFVRKALQRFSLTGSLHSRRTSVNKSRTSTSSSLSKEEFPIELRNIDEESISTAIGSPIEPFVTLENKSLNNSNTSHSNLINGSSLLSIIKEHIISFQFQFKTKHNINNEPNKRNGFLQRKLSQHRFSLPINFKRNPKSNTDSNIINPKNRIDLQQFTTKLSSDQNRTDLESKKSSNETKDKNKKKEGMVKILQKSFSSDSLESRQASLDATGNRLVAYYSMPELYTLNESEAYQVLKSNRSLKNKPKLLELHPITFLIKNIHPKNSNECQTENKSIPESENLQNKSSNAINNCDDNKQIEKVEQIDENEILLEREEMNDKIQSESSPQQQCNKFAKKLLRQRSFSADYQPEVPKAQNEQPRRFSASPNIGSTRVNQITHHQQISIDSEESFVTIIPANRSTRESVTDAINSDTFADFDQDYLTSSTDDDAYCEEIVGEQTSQDDTSASSVTQVTKSESECQSSTPSPPTTLHRYFHVFRSGELEQLIEQNIQDLHVINSYYNERATSWCVVVEKVHVWTI
jgi:ubiquinone/menaquinone biosynthesis C-methylase UbiE